MPEYGIVQYFDASDGKKFGFLQPTDEYGNTTGEKDIFFHLNEGRCVVNDGSKPTFGSSGAVFRRLFDYPEEGDMLVFERAPAPKGDKASPWSYADKWDETVFQLGFDSDFPHKDPDDGVSTTEVYSRAYAHSGDHTMAREASQMYAGDFM